MVLHRGWTGSVACRSRTSLTSFSSSARASCGRCFCCCSSSAVSCRSCASPRERSCRSCSASPRAWSSSFLPNSYSLPILGHKDTTQKQDFRNQTLVTLKWKSFSQPPYNWTNQIYCFDLHMDRFLGFFNFRWCKLERYLSIWTRYTYSLLR